MWPGLGAGKAGGGAGPSPSGSLSISWGRGLSVFFLKWRSPTGERGRQGEGREDQFPSVFSWFEGGRGWLQNRLVSSKVWSLVFSKFSRVLCVVVRCELVACSPKRKGEAQKSRQEGRSLHQGPRLPHTRCGILGRRPKVSGPQLVDL